MGVTYLLTLRTLKIVILVSGAVCELGTRASTSSEWTAEMVIIFLLH